MNQIISKTNYKLSKTRANVKKIIKDQNNNLIVFDPELHIHVCPKTEVIPLGPTAIFKIIGLKYYLKNRTVYLDLRTFDPAFCAHF